MKFKKIILKSGLFQKTVCFSEKANMVYSKKNSTGKTTFLRAIIYALGFPVPSTKGIRFDNMEFELYLESRGSDFKIYRRNTYISIDDGIDILGYSLPSEFYEVIGKITGCSNVDILDNLLGSFYLDQEKGWTLLNRGKVIGNISFDIDELVRGLADIDCSDKIEELEAVQKQLKKYEYMYSVSDYQKEINQTSGNIVYDTSDDILDREIEVLRVEKSSISDELKQIRKVLRKNNSFANYIKDMKLIVQSDNGEQIPVTEDTLMGFNDNNEFLSARCEILNNQLSTINNNIKEIETQKHKDETLFNVQTMIEEFDSDISKIQVDAIATQSVINKLKDDRKKLKKQIKRETKSNTSVITDLYDCISKYAKELDVDNYIRPNKDYIFTSDLKSLSGSILHKIVFCFRLAYLKEIKEKTNIVLPIILDSPSGREVEISTVNKMLAIIQRDYADHQLIVSSIYNFDMKDKNIIEFKEHLFEMDDIINIVSSK